MSENNGHDRDERGRFRKGHGKPGPGRPPRHTETPIRVVQLDDWYGNANQLEDSA